MNINKIINNALNFFQLNECINNLFNYYYNFNNII